MTNNVILKRYLPLIIVIGLGIVAIHSVFKRGSGIEELELHAKPGEKTIAAEIITDTAAVIKNEDSHSKQSQKSADKNSPPELEATTDILAGLPETTMIPSEKETKEKRPKPVDIKEDKTAIPTETKHGMDAMKDKLTELTESIKSASTVQETQVDTKPATKENIKSTVDSIKATATSNKATNAVTVQSAVSSDATNIEPNTDKQSPDEVALPVPQPNQIVNPEPVERIMLDARLPGVNTTIQSLELTYSHATDVNFTKFNALGLDALIPFIHNDTNKWFCNKDGTCYENWLDMKFPPNANWDTRYKTPCYTNYVTGRFRCIPQIYLVGWAKSGTTDLWWFWNNHPQLIHSFYKETQFISQFAFFPDHKQMKPYDTLLQHFFDVRSEEKQKPHPERIMYDCTATIIYDNWHWKIKQGYMGDPDVPKYTNFHYLRKLHSGAQIVVLMRNPTTRALSFYNHGIDMSINKNANLQFVYKDMPKSPEDIHKFFVDSIYYFEACVKAKSLRACCHLSGWESQDWGDPQYFMTLRIGIYYVFLEEVYKNFPPSQIYLIKSEDYYGDQHTTLNGLFTFMNISTQYTDKMINDKGGQIMMNVHKYFTPLPETYRLLQKFYAPYNRRLIEMLNNNHWLKWEAELDHKIASLETGDAN